MRAAVVTVFDRAPRYEEFPTPTASGPDDLLVQVLAAGLHPRVRSQADGSHYTSTDQLPLIPGIDGVGRTPDGTLRYFILPDTNLGAMADYTVIDIRRSVPLPPGTDPIQVAAAMNPAMSSWLALGNRISFQPGQRVLVLGATGNAGRMAIQVARHLGAEDVVAVGRGADRLADLDAERTVSLDDDPATIGQRLGDAAADVDVVLDYLWGQPAADALVAMVPRRADDSQALHWIQIGSVAGAQSPIPSAALRATNLRILGSGQGSIPTRGILRELPHLAAEINRGTFDIQAKAMPLADVEQAWARAAASSQRLVLVP
ncbi:MAG: zinc-binding alcohol dehydrogenase family protein [Gordonia polyisoprenivorans]|nr:zinc-binding alcohol dehydrogenase family protein [Gordonia polyisoprenivorans]